MTNEEIIRMMRDACDKDKVDPFHNDFWCVTQEELSRFVELIKQRVQIEQMPKFEYLEKTVREDEREICAGLCDGIANAVAMSATPKQAKAAENTARSCAMVIRARSKA